MSDVNRVWYKALELDELPEGRVKPVTRGLATVCMTHYQGQYAALDNECPPKRTARRGLDRERFPPLSVARVGLPPAHRQTAGRLRRRRSDAYGRKPRRWHLRRIRRSRIPTWCCAHHLQRHGRDHGQLGSTIRFRNGGSLESRPRRSTQAPTRSRAPRTIIVEDGERTFDKILCRQPLSAGWPWE